MWIILKMRELSVKGKIGSGEIVRGYCCLLFLNVDAWFFRMVTTAPFLWKKNINSS